MTHVLIDRATLEQLVVALEDSIDCARHEYETYWGHGLPTRKAQIDRMKESLDQHEASITAGRAALANAEPAINVRTVTVSKFGVSFGNTTVSHERITGRNAEALNEGSGGIVSNEYMKWLDRKSVV